MEDTLRGLANDIENGSLEVLILVLMEDTLRDTIKLWSFFQISLNPCFNGRYSQSINYLVHNFSVIVS